MIRYVVFDMDKTLVESCGMRDAFAYACREHNIDVEPALELWDASRGYSLYQALEILAGVPDDHPIAESFCNAFWSQLGDMTPSAINGADIALRGLHEASDVKLYVSTGSPGDVASKWLKGLGWDHYFELILGSDPGMLKGAPHYEQIINHAGVDEKVFAASAATIGDGQYDMQYGVDHGVVLRVGYAAGSSEAARELSDSGATHIIDCMSKVPELVLADRKAQPA